MNRSPYPALRRVSKTFSRTSSRPPRRHSPLRYPLPSFSTSNCRSKSPTRSEPSNRPLSFHALTNCSFRNFFVFKFIQNDGGVYPPPILNRTRRPNPFCALSDPSDKNTLGVCTPNPFRMNTCKSVSKQRSLTPFRMNTYEKHRGGG